MAKNPHLLFYNCAEAEKLVGRLEGDWTYQSLKNLDEVETTLLEQPSSVLLAKQDDKGELDDWSAKNKSIALFIIFEKELPKLKGSVVDWLRLPIGADELEMRLTHGYRQYNDHSHLIKYSQKIIRDRNIQSQMNDRLLKVSIELKIAKEEIERLSLTDSLTQLKNRRFFDFQLERDILQSTRYKTPLSMYILDIDNFKRVNDTYGHQAGDEVLIGLADIIKKTLRDTDWAARYGGEEFCIILPMTELIGAQKSAARIRERVENNLTDKDNNPITVSIGLTGFNPTTMDQEKLIYFADHALYQAKSTGKNRVVMYNEINKEYSETSSGKPQPNHRRE